MIILRWGQEFYRTLGKRILAVSYMGWKVPNSLCCHRDLSVGILNSSLLVTVGGLGDVGSIRQGWGVVSKRATASGE